MVLAEIIVGIKSPTVAQSLRPAWATLVVKMVESKTTARLLTQRGGYLRYVAPFMHLLKQGPCVTQSILAEVEGFTLGLSQEKKFGLSWTCVLFEFYEKTP